MNCLERLELSNVQNFSQTLIHKISQSLTKSAQNFLNERFCLFWGPFESF